ncbi:MAG: hypothetical protein JWM16_1895 [Verrucomicrobiales bacterium]|jgi:hypothetical protein|nr:hypothetical protein [Verrucomicrobiales bacterium]
MRVTIFTFSLVGILTSGPQLLQAAEIKVTPFPPTPPTNVPSARVDFFRKLVNMTAQERAVALASRDEQQKRVIYVRLREFDQLSPEEREVRLERMKLRSQLISLLHSSLAERQTLLTQFPEDDRPGLEERLGKWDQLPPGLQKAVLENESMLNCVMPGQTVSSNQLQQILATLPPDLTQKLAKDLDRWNSMPVKDREKMYDEFRGLFDLDAAERAKTLQTLSNEERLQMEKTLEAFRNFPKFQRDQCILSFEKFANMTLAERAQFVRNAQSWQQLSSEERQKWRTIVNQFPPFPPSPIRRNIPAPPAPPPILPVTDKASLTSH